jgi:predicted secreted protein
MTWNHRVLRHIDAWGDEFVTFAEVFYDDNGKPEGYSTVCMVGDNIEEIREIANRLLKAADQPVLDATIFESEV